MDACISHDVGMDKTKKKIKLTLRMEGIGLSERHTKRFYPRETFRVDLKFRSESRF